MINKILCMIKKACIIKSHFVNRIQAYITKSFRVDVLNKTGKNVVRVFGLSLSFCLILCISGLFLTGCSVSENEGADDGKQKIVTTLYAPYDFAKNVGGDRVNVKMLLAPGEESHSYDPTPQDIMAIEHCDLFIYNGGENESWVEDILSSLDRDISVIKMMDLIDTVYEEETVEGMQTEKGHEHKEEDAHEDADSHDKEDAHEDADSHDKEDAHEEYDEHVWTSIDNAVSISEAIYKTLADRQPGDRDYFEKNYEEYRNGLIQVKNDIKNVVDNGCRKTIVLGDRFPMRYFVEEFGLDYCAAFPGCSADTEANALTIKFLIDKVRTEKIPVVFKMELSNGNIAKTIAGETQAKTTTLYACHNISADDFKAGTGYIDLMRRNEQALKEALY